jgi:hypothetical protein
MYISKLGLDWVEIFSEPRTTFLTPDQLGLFFNVANGSPAITSIFSLAQG